MRACWTIPNGDRVLSRRFCRSRVSDKVSRRDQIEQLGGERDVYSSWIQSGAGRSEHSRFLCHGIVAGSQGPLIESPPAFATGSFDRWIIVQQHEPIIRSRCERIVVAGKTLINQLNERLFLLCAQGDKLKFLRVNRIKEAIKKFLVIRSSGAKCEYLTHCWRGVACNALLADRSKGLSRVCCDSTAIYDAPRRSCKQLPSKLQTPWGGLLNGPPVSYERTRVVFGVAAASFARGRCLGAQ